MYYRAPADSDITPLFDVLKMTDPEKINALFREELQ
jgi:hypothetical protein